MDWPAVTGLDLAILGPALVAGFLVLATHVPLGAVALGRGIIFINIALAQVAATGVVFGNLMWGAVDGWLTRACAVGAAILVAAFLAWTDKRFPAVQEAIIGVVYVTAAAVQLMMLADSPGGAEFLKTLLIGQILWVTPLQLAGTALVYAIAMMIWYFRDLSRERAVFYVVFAVVIALSVQIAGILLIFATLILPALAALVAQPRWRLLVAFNIGAVGYIGGIIVSAIFNTPASASIVCMLIPAAIMAGLFLWRSKRMDAGPEPDAPLEKSSPSPQPPQPAE